MTHALHEPSNTLDRRAARLCRLLLGLVCAATTAVASGAYVTVTYDGVVSTVMNPAETPDIHVGDIVTYSATFDPSTAVDISQTFYNIDGITGLPVPLPNLRSISLATDPNASDRITIGSSYVFTQDDDPDFGRTFGLGAGRFPLVLYNGADLLGFDIGADVDGFYVFSDPLAFLLHHSPATGYGGLNSSDDLGFLVTTDRDGAIAAATAVPEPGTLSLILFGIGLSMAALRRRRPVGAAARPGPATFLRRVAVCAACVGPAVASAADRGIAAPDAPETAYVAGVHDQLARTMRFPTGREASLARPEGTVSVWFVLSRDGGVVARGLERTSRSPLLDAQALQLVGRGRYDALPAAAWSDEPTHRFVATYRFVHSPLDVPDDVTLRVGAR